MLVLACTGGTPPTPTPAGPTPAPTATGATPSGTGTTTPAPTGTGGAPTATPGEGTPSTAPSGGIAPPDQQVLRLYLAADDPPTLRPQEANSSDAIAVLGGIQRGLLYRDGEGNLVPSLATDLPEVSADLLTYTYHLRDAMYSNGTPIVAGDIVRGARALADPRNGFYYSYEMCYVEGAYALLGTDFGCPEGETPYLDPEAGTFDDAVVDGLLDQLGVTAPDEKTVVFQLVQPTSFWPDITAMWLLTPVPEAQTTWAEAADNISSGPFQLSEWTHQSLMVLTPNPNWYGVQPALQRIELHIGGAPAAALALWEQGGLDYVTVPSSDQRRVLATADYAGMINRGTTLSIEYWDFANCPDADTCPPNASVGDAARIPGGSPTQNFHFRQALTQAIDKTELINVTFAGIGAAAFSPTMPGIPGFPTVTADNTPFPFDAAAALANMAIALDELAVGAADPELAATLVTDTCDQTCADTKARVQQLAPLKFGYNCDAGHDQRVLYMAQAWRVALGFTGSQMDIRCTDFGTLINDRASGKVYDIARNGWGADFPHPDNQNRDLFGCGVGNNNSKYCNPDYGALLNQGATAASYEDSLPFYQQAEELLVQDAPVFFMRYGEGIRLVRPYVGGLTLTPSFHQNIGDDFYETIQILAH